MMKQSPLFSNVQTDNVFYDEAERASYKGITLKTFILLAIAALVGGLTAAFLPRIIESGNYTSFYIALAISSVVGFISVMVGRMSPSKAKYFCAVYAICEGLFLGSLTCIVSLYVPHVASIAIFSTLVIFAVMLTLFGTGILRVGSKFRKFCFAFSIGAIALVLFSTIFSICTGSYLTSSEYFGIYIGIELFLLIYGIITLGLNFSEAQYVVEAGADKNSEWQVALGLTVSLIYIYVEIVRLLLLFASNRD